VFFQALFKICLKQQGMVAPVIPELRRIRRKIMSYIARPYLKGWQSGLSSKSTYLASVRP
jgi:hypothetical protein